MGYAGYKQLCQDLYSFVVTFPDVGHLSKFRSKSHNYGLIYTF